MSTLSQMQTINDLELMGQKLRQVFTSPVKRVLLVVPPEIPEPDFRLEMARKQRYACFPPYGTGLLARELQRRCYESDTLDLNYEMLFSANNDVDFDYGAWQERLLKKLADFQPDVVGITCMFTMGHQQLLNVANAVKAAYRKIPVLVGGVHPTNAAPGVLKSSPSIDFIQLYEAELSFPDTLDFVNGRLGSEGLSQLASIVNGNYVALKNRRLPSDDDLNVAPLYHSLPIGNYDKVGQIGAYSFLCSSRRASTILGNRGCRARCSFCSVRSFNGPGVRGRTVSSVVDEMQRAAEQYGIRHFMWLDDDLFYPHDRTVELFNEIVKRGLDITWDATNGVIAAAMTDEIMSAASESGCIGLALGIESGSPEILRAVHKPGTVDSFRKAKELLDKYPHIFVRGFLIIGFPNETMFQLLQTVNLALELSFDWYPVQILNPLPSTEIYKTMIEQGLVEDNMQVGSVVFIGPAGKQRLIEERQKLDADEFFDLFDKRDRYTPIRKEDLSDLWFLVDYKLNYEKILLMTDKTKLHLQGQMLKHICDRLTVGNAMSNLFCAICDQKLGDGKASLDRIPIIDRYLNESAYWQKRFAALGLYELFESVRDYRYIPGGEERA